MNIRKSKGITLISLVITIIILIILAGVSINLVLGENGLFNMAKNAVKQTDMASIKEKIQTEILEEQLNNEGNITNDTLKEILESYGELSNEENILDRTLTTSEGNYAIKVSEIFSGTTVKDPIIEDKSGASKPNVRKISQKTYVTWELNEAGTAYEMKEKQTVAPDYWYDYEKGKWANIKTSQNGLEAYWVWIPRYEYKVPTSTTAVQIEVKFIDKTKTTPDEGYTIHPVFTNAGNGGFGELDGIWVAKFETVSSSPEADKGGGADGSLKVQVIPNQPSWRGLGDKGGIAFKACRNMTNSGGVLEGSKVDSHMMKNTEWGAVAILSQSKYGVYNLESLNGKKGNSEYQIWNNPSSEQYITGYVGPTKDSYYYHKEGEEQEQVQTQPYNSANGPKASTTGTIYGVYDMAGGTIEAVAGTMKGKTDNLEYAKSMFDIENQTKPEGMTTEDFAKKYIDLYEYYDYAVDEYNFKCISGDALKETQKWNQDYSGFLNTAYPIFGRGYGGSSATCGIFAFDNITFGESGTFRVVMIPQ